MDYSVLDNGEIIDSGYGFIDNRGIEVCSDSELYELEQNNPEGIRETVGWFPFVSPFANIIRQNK